MKFGAAAQQPQTWAMNVYLPALVCEHFSTSRIVALSTGNVYPFTSEGNGGSVESDEADPRGEYAQSCLGRERIFQYGSLQRGTPVAIIRLNYANEPRYGVIVDISHKILNDEPIDLEMGYVNLIWQGDANDYIARSISLTDSPAYTLNVTGPEIVSVRRLATIIGTLVGREPQFIRTESPTALLSNAKRCFEAFGPPAVSLQEMIEIIVDWVSAGRRILSKPTKFQVRDGKF
jgi:nucleoside-diphosphate-sugar epimerase